VIVKHNNPCGVAVGASALEAYEKAFACDPLSAFGGVLVFNRRIDAALAERLSQQFIEVLLAPGFEEDALAILTRKEAIRILDVENVGYEPRARDLKKVRGGLLAQDQDIVEESRETMEVATVAQPAEEQWDDLLFAWKVCKHVRSNAIVFAKNGATVGIGAGQMSRVDSVRLAVEKCAEAFGEQANEMLRESVVASDAFFPFADGPQGAIDAGATAVIQPGGSKRDDEVIAACDAAGVAMVLTGRRHFRH
jgi:phosphoribosylaminoimidazolecarboxamide formyltransferase/IMP cyclohydrolase